MTTLTPRILTELTRLGATFSPPSGPRTVAGHPVPAPLADFLFGVKWPVPRPPLYTPEDSALWVWQVVLGFRHVIKPDEVRIADHGDRVLVAFGQTDGGNYLLVLDLADPHPADPLVYKVDHDDPTQKLVAYVSLAELLQLLQVVVSTSA